MAQPALHFAVGATCMTAITAGVGPLRRRWFCVGPLLAMVGGLWACLPDADHLLRYFGVPLGDRIATLEYVHGSSVWWDVFFFHGWLDRHLPGRGTIVGLAWTVGLLGIFFWLSARKVVRLERQLSALETAGKSEEKGAESRETRS